MRKNAIEYQKFIISKVDNPLVIVDATLGKGNDSLYLSKKFPNATIYCFDIQKEAIVFSKKMLSNENVSNVKIINDSHYNFNKHLPDKKIDLVLFNLGFLPGSNKEIHTDGDVTVKTIDKLLNYLNDDGIICIVSYPGSIRGRIENIDIVDFIQKIDQKYFEVSKIEFLNQKNYPPILYIIKKNSIHL